MNERSINIERNGRSRITLPDGRQAVIIEPPDEEFNADEVNPPRRLTRLNPGYLAGDLSSIFDVNYQGVKGVTQDLVLTYPLDQIIAGAGEPAATFQISSTDAVQSFSPAQLLVGTRAARAALISVQTAAIHFSFVSDPDQATAGHVLSPTGNPEFILLEGIQLLENFNFISAAAATPGVLNVSMRT